MRRESVRIKFTISRLSAPSGMQPHHTSTWDGRIYGVEAHEKEEMQTRSMAEGEKEKWNSIEIHFMIDNKLIDAKETESVS